MSGYWQPGSEIIWRYGRAEGPWWELPTRVVADDQKHLVAWMPVGTPIRKLVRRDGRSPRVDRATMFTAERVQVDGVWQRTSVLRIAMPGKSWSLWVFFDGESKEFQGWYGNIEEPYRRDATGIYTRDHVLDVGVAPDRRHRRKDEDELILAVQQGRYTQEQAEQITAVADEIEAAIEAWESPFCDGWEHFRPDPAWPLPRLHPS